MFSVQYHWAVDKKETTFSYENVVLNPVCVKEKFCVCNCHAARGLNNCVRQIYENF